MKHKIHKLKVYKPKKVRRTITQLLAEAKCDHDVIRLNFVEDKWTATLIMQDGSAWFWSDESLERCLYEALYNPAAEMESSIASTTSWCVCYLPTTRITYCARKTAPFTH